MSYSISLNPSQLAGADIIALLNEQNAIWCQALKNALNLQFLQPSRIFSAQASDPLSFPELCHGSIRVFGNIAAGPLLHRLSQVLSDNNRVKLSLLTPHPGLPAGLLIQLYSEPTAKQQQQLAALAIEQQIELVYLSKPVQLSKPGLLVMDMDSTAISIECIDEIAALAGVGEKVAAITARAMNGELDFAASLTERVAALKDAPETVLQQVAAGLPLMPGLVELVAWLQQQQWQVAIASGGFTYFTDILKQQLTLTAAVANVLEISNGVLTGRVSGGIVDANSKAEVVSELATKFNIAPEQTVAIGDGANDLPMLKTAALGVAFHAKPKVQAAVSARINQGSLLQLLYLLDPA